ncbi:hypothetical protein AB0M80_29925 [Amycolatopsis sp. NPDC051045]|uniref:hypothetical protein n=1 Tax=Amycolatopsis sp. NPDC051045 TaxID=3156922 RepID=UPI0034467174
MHQRGQVHQLDDRAEPCHPPGVGPPEPGAGGEQPGPQELAGPVDEPADGVTQRRGKPADEPGEVVPDGVRGRGHREENR